MALDISGQPAGRSAGRHFRCHVAGGPRCDPARQTRAENGLGRIVLADRRHRLAADPARQGQRTGLVQLRHHHHAGGVGNSRAADVRGVGTGRTRAAGRSAPVHAAQFSGRVSLPAAGLDGLLRRGRDHPVVAADLSGLHLAVGGQSRGLRRRAGIRARADHRRQHQPRRCARHHHVRLHRVRTGGLLERATSPRTSTTGRSR